MSRATTNTIFRLCSGCMALISGGMAVGLWQFNYVLAGVAAVAYGLLAVRYAVDAYTGLRRWQ